MADTSRTDLSRFLNPRGIAVVGVSNDAARIGGQTLCLLTDFGYTGKIYPVNPRYTEVKGLTCYPDLTAVPKPCDVALIALSAAQRRAGAIEQCGKAGIPFALVLAGGFSEIGAEGKALQEKLIETARKANVRMVGPNCLGIINLKDNARIGFGGTAQLKTLKPGPMAMVTQSGGFGFGVVAIAALFRRRLQLRHLHRQRGRSHAARLGRRSHRAPRRRDRRRVHGSDRRRPPPDRDRRARARAGQAGAGLEGRQHRRRQPGGDLALGAADRGLRAVPRPPSGAAAWSRSATWTISSISPRRFTRASCRPATAWACSRSRAAPACCSPTAASKAACELPAFAEATTTELQKDAGLVRVLRQPGGRHGERLQRQLRLLRQGGRAGARRSRTSTR